MKNSFTQKYFEEILLEDLTPDQFFTLAIETSKLLGWSLGGVCKTSFTAYTNSNFLNGNAEIKLKVWDDRASLLSQSRNLATIEFEKDQRNLKNFMDQFNKLKQASVTAEFPSNIA